MRKVICSNCGRTAGKGSSRVLRKLLFHFCELCTKTRREQCDAFMAKAAA